MNTIIKGFQASLIALIVLSAIVIAVPVAHADDYFGDCCTDYGYTDYGSWDSGYTDYGAYDSGYTDYGAYDAGYTDYGSYDAGYTDYGYDAGYTDYGAGYTDYGAGYTDYGAGYTDYAPGYTDYSYSEAPVYYDSEGVMYTNSYMPTVTSYPVTFTPIDIHHPIPTPIPTPTPVPAPTPIVVTAPSTQQQQQQQTSTNINNNPNTNTNNNQNVNNINITIPAQTVQTVPVLTIPAIQQPIVYQQPTYVQPYCTITISNGYTGGYDYNYGYGNGATLSWSASNASSAYISGVGSVNLSGTRLVYPTSNQIYTMTVYGVNGQSATCQTTFYAPIAYNNPAPYVSLSQIPYTGLDLGPIGTAIYWGSMVAFALAAAYLVIYFRGGALAFAGSTIVKREEDVIVPTKADEKLASVLVDETSKMNSFDLPVVPTSRFTVDSMSIKTSGNGTPTLVITRN